MSAISVSLRHSPKRGYAASMPDGKRHHLVRANEARISKLCRRHAEQDKTYGQISQSQQSRDIGKTKAVNINTPCYQLISFSNQQIEKVNGFCYLRSVITANGGSMKDIESRIAKAASTFGRLQPV